MSFALSHTRIAPLARMGRAARGAVRGLHAGRAVRAESDGLGPLALFLPVGGREGAALLRIYTIAEALKPLGWRCAVLPPALTLAQRHQMIAEVAPDLLVMQGARLALNRPWLYPGRPIVFDMDDADFHLPHLSGPVERAMPHVAMVTAGSDYVARWCRAAGAGGAEVIWTGAPVSTRARPPQHARGLVIAWAQTRPMTYTREAGFVRQVMQALAARHGGATLRLYDRQPGDDPGFAESFRAPGLNVEWLGAMDYDRYLASFDDVALGLAPLAPDTPFSRGKSFGKVLAYLDRMVPVLASDACEHGRFFTPETGIVSNEADVWVTQAARLLKDAPARQHMAEAAFWAYQISLSTTSAAERADQVYRQVLWQARKAEIT